MRILHISTRLILGGSQENTLLSCEGQARLGHEVHLAFGPIYGPEGSMLERVQAFNDRCRSGEEIRVDGGAVPPIRTYEILDMVREISPLRDRRAYRQLSRLIRELTPDIVHTHSSKAGILGRYAAYREYELGQRLWELSNGWTCGIVHTIHGPPFMPIDGDAVQRVKRRVMNTLYTLSERFAAKKCDVIVSVADAMTREFLRRGIGRPGQFVTVYSGMETARFLTPAPGESRDEMRRELGFAPDDFVVGTVARLAEHKGHDDLLDALGPLMQTTPRLKLLWVGDGWWRERLLTRARTLGLRVEERDQGTEASRHPGQNTVRPAQVILTGLVPPEAVPKHIRAMDVLAHPSYREGLPRTVPQALLCGVCPVAYDVDGTGEICRDMETGRLVPLGDRERLRSAIVWCIQHPAEREQLAARGRDECSTRFSADRMVAELAKIYARALAAARSQ